MERVAVANQSKFLIYDIDELGRFQLAKEFKNPLGRIRDRRMRYDKPGMNRARLKGSAPHSLQKELRPSEEARIQFAKRVSEVLRKDLMNDPQLTLKIAAEDKFLGLLRPLLRANELQKIKWVKKDIENVPKTKWPTLLKDIIQQTS